MLNCYKSVRVYYHSVEKNRIFVTTKITLTN